MGCIHFCIDFGREEEKSIQTLDPVAFYCGEYGGLVGSACREKGEMRDSVDTGSGG